MNNMKNTKIVCLGGGIGTVNLLRGLKNYTKDITVIISMADDGGSSGRLRRLYNMLPVGDLVSCMSVMSKDKENDEFISKLLTYRFNGERYGKDHELGGHKLGNLLIVALKDITGSYEQAILEFKKIFHVEGTFLPATDDSVTISAKNIDGREIFGEEKIDLGKYRWKRVLDKVFLHPADAAAASGVVDAIMNAEVVVLGPGDLYTNLLPVLIVPQISEAMRNTKAKKIYIVNVANKPEETQGYKVSEYITAIKKHIGDFPFDVVIVNNNSTLKIPEQFNYYQYVQLEKEKMNDITIVTEDLVNEKFPLYHSPEKLAKVIWENI